MGSSPPATVHGRLIDESYIPKTKQAPADAGAGLDQHSYQPPPPPKAHPSSDQFLYQNESLGVLQSRLATESTSVPMLDVPTLPFASSSPALILNVPTPTTTSRTGASHTGLSTELRRILSMSMALDPSDVNSVMMGSGGGSLIPTSAGEGGGARVSSWVTHDREDRRAERQYMWLERYHSHVAAQQRDLSGTLGATRSSAHAPPADGHDAPDDHEADPPFGSIV